MRRWHTKDVDESALWIETPAPSEGWGWATRTLDLDRIRSLAEGPLPGDDDLESAQALTDLVHTAYMGYGTDGAKDVNDEESRIILRSVRLVLNRHGITLNVPWRDFPSFRTYWNSHGAHGSWQARREMLATHFDPVFHALRLAEERTMRSELAEAISPHSSTGWMRVDEEIAQLRLRFRTATGMQDYRDTGNRCVAVLEALSAQVYNHSEHGNEGEQEPPVDKTNIRLERYINTRLPGSSNEELRGLTRKASALAHKVKHSPNADRTSAGITADTVILLANILRRLAE